MRVLGIESSCDETGVAVYDTDLAGSAALRAHAVYSQIALHAEYGGVVPELASRDHVRKLLPLVRQTLADAGLELTPRGELPPPPRMPNLGEAFPRPYQDADRIAADPEYGTIVCFCERVTAGEIRDACRSTIPPSGVDGLRRRTRAMNGRCQGFFCGAEVSEAFDRQVVTR